jgi:hypothetical protein
MRYFLLFLFISIPAFGDETASMCTGDSNDLTYCVREEECAYSAGDIEKKMNDDLQSCEDQKKSATNCCSSGQGCGGSGGSGIGSDMSQLMMIMKGAAGMAAVMNASSGQLQDMSQVCMMNGLLGGTGGSVNSTGSAACSDAKDTCDRYCLGRDDYYNNLRACLKTADAKSFIDKHKSPFKRTSTQCDAITSTQRAQANNMNNVGNSNGMNGVCNQVQQQQQLQAIAAPASVDCSSPLISNTPACTQCSGDPSSSPACAKAVTDAAATVAGFQPASAQTGSPNNIAIGNLNGLTQGPHFPDANTPGAQAAPFNQFGQGGSGGMAPNQNQQQGVGGGPAGPHGYGAGVDGKAYTLSERSGTGGAGSGANGFVDYGATGAPNDPSRNTASLDLRRYLPGQKLYPNRKVAGVGSANPDINARTTDIFKRISDRFQVICSLNRLVDCTPAKMPNKSGL